MAGQVDALARDEPNEGKAIKLWWESMGNTNHHDRDWRARWSKLGSQRITLVWITLIVAAYFAGRIPAERKAAEMVKRANAQAAAAELTARKAAADARRQAESNFLRANRQMELLTERMEAAESQ